MAAKVFCDYCRLEKPCVVVKVEGEVHPHNGDGGLVDKDVCVECVNNRFGCLVKFVIGNKNERG